MLRLFVALALSLLPAKGLDGPRTHLGIRWVAVPAQEGAPAFSYQLAQQGEALHLHLQFPPGIDPGPWAAQVWIADAGMVLHRKHLLRDATRALRDYEGDAAGLGADDPGCRSTLAAFLDRARPALKAIQAYDPFRQVVLGFGQAPPAAAGVEVGALAQEQLEPGANCWAWTYPFDGRIDVGSRPLNVLQTRVALVPAAEPKPRSVRERQLTSMVLNPAWDLDSRVIEPEVTLPLAGTEAGPWLATPGGYRVSEVGEVAALPCYGAQGRFVIPALWVPRTFPLVAPPTDLTLPITLHADGTALLMRCAGQPPKVLRLGKLVSGAAEFGWRWLHGSTGPTGTTLLLQVTSASRPGSPISRCGAGEEVDLVFLRMDPAGRRLRQQGFLIGSCWKALETEDPEKGDPQWQWSILDLGRSAPGGKVWKRVLRFDPEHPDRGIQVRDVLQKVAP